MIPVKLTIEGLYSYQERQIIEFNNLTEAGLFGIFGKVGSGKSSILEAITFVLYGETERLNNRDKRAYNMMNLKSNRSYIEFDFYNYENKLFRATREFKRNSKNFEDVKSPTVVLYEFKNETWIPLESSDIERIIGLSYKNFKRTIIIPQGQFKEFIELGATDRTKMMKEIFNLHRFDLQDKVSGLVKRNSSNLDQLQGKLSGFEEVSVQKIEELEVELKLAKEHSKIVLEEHLILSEAFEKLKRLKLDFDNLRHRKIEFETLKEQKINIDKKEKNLVIYERIFNSFYQLLKDQIKYSTELELKKHDVENQKKQFLLTENQLKEITKELEIIQPQFEKLHQKRQEETDLVLIAEIVKFTKEIETLKERTQKGLFQVEEVKQNEIEINQSIEKKEQEIKDLKANKVDSQIIFEVGNWFNTAKNLHNSISNQQKKNEQVQLQINQLKEELTELNVDKDSFEKENIAFKNQFLNRKKEIEEKRNQLEVQQKLAQYAHELHDGEACPLCGSAEHPHIIEVEDVSNNLALLKDSYVEIETEETDWQLKVNKVQQIFSRLQIFEDQLKQENSLIDDLNNQSINHLKLFIWTNFDSANYTHFQEIQQNSIRLEKEIEQKNEALKNDRIVLEKERQDLDKFSKALENFKLEEGEKLARINQNKANLKVLSFDDFKTFSEEDILFKAKELSQLNQKIEQTYQALNLNLNDLNPKLASQKTSITLIETQIKEILNELNQVNTQINTSLAEHYLHKIEDVNLILNQHLNISEEQKEINNFKVKYETAKQIINDLELKLDGLIFDENAFEETEIKFKNSEILKNEASEKVALIKANIDRLTKEFEAKKELLEEQAALQKRADNLKTMKSLFDSAGFVQYVSSIYLQQLCENANVRFHRMTRNQLSLQINENNDFEIVDYLNEGRTRSVKTLSGGQGFQVSLSLALALAESVQANVKAEKNFFFIDEGFGTQDTEAVNIVFETLMNLQKENRIVGIISHVDELKDRIPVALSIVKDEEKGSLIELI
ncbi:SMC family ATPase [Algoriella sp.]|uniref:SMC family ATPase n=1 Tax=Algoriella sp. TaxID=1872434 RepID=UPI001B05D8D4|nr:SMC family ATPase [Algoriella sp.]MBO6213034.1 SMC family ATPase [Algoriella sp.]